MNPISKRFRRLLNSNGVEQLSSGFGALNKPYITFEYYIKPHIERKWAAVWGLPNTHTHTHTQNKATYVIDPCLHTNPHCVLCLGSYDETINVCDRACHGSVFALCSAWFYRGSGQRIKLGH